MDSNHRPRPYQGRALHQAELQVVFCPPVFTCLTAQDGLEPPSPDSKSGRLPPTPLGNMDRCKLAGQDSNLQTVALTVRCSTVELPTNGLPGVDSNHQCSGSEPEGLPLPNQAFG